jgi:hypothetical protein
MIGVCNKWWRILNYLKSQITHLRSNAYSLSLSLFLTTAFFSVEVRLSFHYACVLGAVCGSYRCKINKGAPLWRRTYLWCLFKRFAAAFHWPLQIKQFSLLCRLLYLHLRNSSYFPIIWKFVLTVCRFRMVTKMAYDRMDHFIIKFRVLYIFNAYWWGCPKKREFFISW